MGRWASWSVRGGYACLGEQEGVEERIRRSLKAENSSE